MKDSSGVFARRANRRKFLKKGLIAAGAATVGGLADMPDRERREHGEHLSG